MNEEEGRIALEYFLTIKNVIQDYAGQVKQSEQHIAIARLKQIGHIIEQIEVWIKQAADLEKATKAGLDKHILLDSLILRRKHLSDLLEQQITVAAANAEALSAEIDEDLFRIAALELALNKDKNKKLDETLEVDQLMVHITPHPDA